ncbi:hypothetical protein Leryth_021866 [Lithospermum erythrorhizon]|nr:hypothetical protein Leryth_021866 [Lithospermum erythrorhizon]
MAPINQVTVLESCFAAPPPNTVSEMSHPLSYSDMVWIGFPPVECLLFYQIPVSRSNFIDTIIPQSNLYPLALQVTLFQEMESVLELPLNIFAGDGELHAFFFVKAWAMICKLGEDFEESKGVEFSPTYDRGVMTQHTKKLDDIVWEQLASNKSDEKDLVAFELNRRQDHDKVRSTFVVGLEDVKRLKRLVSDQHGSSSIKHLSTFTVIIVMCELYGKKRTMLLRNYKGRTRRFLCLRG